MPGIMVFRSLKAALDAGYSVYDRRDDGYIVRKRTSAGWAMAIVELKPHAELPAKPDLSQLSAQGLPKVAPPEEFR